MDEVDVHQRNEPARWRYDLWERGVAWFPLSLGGQLLGVRSALGGQFKHPRPGRAGPLGRLRWLFREGLSLLAAAWSRHGGEFGNGAGAFLRSRVGLGGRAVHRWREGGWSGLGGCRGDRGRGAWLGEGLPILHTQSPSAPQTWSGFFGLNVPGTTSTFKIYLLTAEGNERGSNPVTIQRPVP